MDDNYVPLIAKALIIDDLRRSGLFDDKIKEIAFGCKYRIVLSASDFKRADAYKKKWSESDYAKQAEGRKLIAGLC